MNAEDKFDLLKMILRKMEATAIAFSGGVDSSFLLYTACEILGNNITAVIFSSQVIPQRELNNARSFARSLGVNLHELSFDIESLDFFHNNPVNRCYYCKKHLFTKLKEFALKQSLPWVADGTNWDDLNDFRPGCKALEELKIRSPLQEAGLKKEEIRFLSKRMGLSTWDKPAVPCLATRIPYGQPITLKKLNEIEQAEDYLHILGFKNIRVRHDNHTARIELPTDYFEDVLNYREKIVDKFKSLRFTYITLDLEGFRSGSLNERKNLNG
jgi:uncharacterized protein